MKTNPEHDADIVIKNGIATKNRFGEMNKRPAAIYLEDGCYRVVRLDAPVKPAKKRSASKKQTKKSRK